MYLKRKSIFIAMILTVVLFTGCINSQDNNIEKPVNPLTEEMAFEIEEEFFQILLNQERIEEYEIKNYQNKEDLINAISEVADRGLATEYVDEFYTEEDGKLYVIPRGGPAMLLSESSYDFNKIDDNNYEIIQEEEDMLRGAYKLTVKFTMMDGQWKMSERIIE